MRHRKYQKRIMTPAVWILLILAVLAVSFGGVRAYLSHSGGQVSNEFTTDNHPTITVGDDYSVTVAADYAVYLRAAVVVNWDNNSSDTILAAKSGDYALSINSQDWYQHTDGFYYYKQAVTKEKPTTSQLITDVSGAKAGYTLKVDVAVQAIQAVGQTDDDSPVDAVSDAWGIPAEAIKGSN